jgi:hypothetical protein
MRIPKRMSLSRMLVAKAWILCWYSQGNREVKVTWRLELLAPISCQVVSQASEEVHGDQMDRLGYGRDQAPCVTDGVGERLEGRCCCLLCRKTASPPAVSFELQVARDYQLGYRLGYLATAPFLSTVVTGYIGRKKFLWEGQEKFRYIDLCSHTTYPCSVC